jgi:2-oxoisovalerate dehydrogenase E2 component (dihydrolipoyl transacylase)
MPQLGESVTEGTVAQWLKKVGDSVEKYEAFVEVSTDKVNAEVPAPVSGTIRELIVKEGETVPTGAPIAVIDEVAAERAPADPPSSRNEPGTPGANVPPAVLTATVTAISAGAPEPSGNGHAKNAPALLRRVSPAVRRLAREHSIDLSRVEGTGSGGRITANDVVAAANAVSQTAPAAAPQAHAASAERASAKPNYAAPVPGQTIPLTQARKLIAQRMVESKHTAPHAWTMVEVDVSSLWAWRTKEKERFQRDHGVPLTLLPFFIRAVVESLRAHPLLNARFGDDGISVLKQVNIGIAVGLATNLVVPVIRDADALSITGLALAAGRLIERARSGKLSVDDLAGGTFTVNNIGANGSILSAPIINGGQAAIITMEAVVKRPVVVAGDAIAIRSMMNVCLSLDHRVLDGAIAGAFLADLKKRLETMGPGGQLYTARGRTSVSCLPGRRRVAL